MREDEGRYAVAGSSALKPDCSRYRNENERIISFPEARKVQSRSQQVNHGSTRGPVRADASVDRSPSLGKKLRALVGKSMIVSDLKNANLEGTSYGASRLSAVLAGCAYVAFGVAVLFIAI